MSPQPKYCRLAVAMFTDMQALQRAFDALRHIGTDRHQLCLLALKPTMDRALSGENLPGGVGNSLRGAIHEFVVVPRPNGQDTIVATSAAVLQALLNAERAANELARPLRGPQRPHLDVRSQLQDGCVALIVQSIDAAAHQAVVRKMLALSSTSVTTHQGKFLTE